MRETEQFSIPMRDTTPHPTSTKAPKPSRWVTVAGRTVPGGQRSSSARASSWARRRERVSWGGAPSATPVTVKEMGFPTRERMAISRAVPSRMPRAASSRGMVPVKGPRFTSRSWPGVHRTARPSSTVSCSIAWRREERVSQAAWFSGVWSRRPSGRYRLDIHCLPF